MILIVDDDPAITTLLKMSFELEGHVVVTASSGAEALELARRIHPAAMVVDVMMPEMDGLELIRRLRANDATADIPIVCCSARALSHDVQAGYDAGADDYITKPFEPFDLIERVEQRVEQRGEDRVQFRVVD
jgi:DNA-binding response OmpR family regulator